MAISGVSAEERWCIVLRLDADESVVTSQSPTTRVPLDAATNVAREERLGVVDAECGLLEHAEAADAGGHIRDDRAVIGGIHHDVAAVVQEVGRLDVAGHAAELQILGDAERAVHFALDTDESIEVDGDGAAEIVVTETRFVGLRALGEKDSARGDDAHLHASGPGIDFLRIRATRTSDEPAHDDD